MIQNLNVEFSPPSSQNDFFSGHINVEQRGSKKKEQQQSWFGKWEVQNFENESNWPKQWALFPPLLDSKLFQKKLMTKSEMHLNH